ncbi:hypothetical protein GE115_10925 [Agromyces sp. CFH 90414]|uniref:Uncharacterized protein n=1 Tax=Agromyces agglutinans TaxID=2662258 RepID=A0A6I2F6L1_9MICO|nr:hypothetical protein [Agromyces agglutinans]MRG60372.1 hypothetical protein [Agromyces agglutinans]
MATEPETESSVESSAALTKPSGEAAAPSTSDAVAPRVRIRWGWFLACIVLGLSSITVGWFLADPADRLGYVGGVLAGVGTTLLLVGVVVLLERRILDTAVRVVRDAATEARLRDEAAMRAQARDLEERVAEVWLAEKPEEAAVQMRRMIDEFTQGVVDGTTRAKR